MAFLPDLNEATAILTKISETNQAQQQQFSVAAKDFVPKQGPPQVEKQTMTQTKFLFDIDEERSMNSSSTMSTHTSFQSDLLAGAGRFGLAKPFLGAEKDVKIETVYEEIPFEVLQATPVKKTKIRSLRSDDDRRTEQSKSKTIKGGSFDEISHGTRETVLMTLTESSSSEDSSTPWLVDFGPDDFTSNPFQELAQPTFPMQQAKRKAGVATRSTSQRHYNTSGLSHDFSKYSAMMIRGSSVAEVTKIMAYDQVHPSIISLVMIAASENHQQ